MFNRCKLQRLDIKGGNEKDRDRTRLMRRRGMRMRFWRMGPTETIL